MRICNNPRVTATAPKSVAVVVDVVVCCNCRSSKQLYQSVDPKEEIIFEFRIFCLHVLSTLLKQLSSKQLYQAVVLNTFFPDRGLEVDVRRALTLPQFPMWELQTAFKARVTLAAHGTGRFFRLPSWQRALGRHVTVLLILSTF